MNDDKTMLYHANDLIFELPARLKDKTMHMFTLSDDGASEFSMVVSHAETQPGEALEEFGARLIQEMMRALPKFQLRHNLDAVLDNAAALDLAYSWRRDGIFMHQRQVIALTQGDSPGSTRAILIAATCLSAFSDEWSAAFDRVLASVKLRRPLGAAAQLAQATQETAPAPSQPFIFALSERRRLLHVFGDQEEACRKTDAREVEQDAWAFFDAGGRPLQARFMVPNSGSLWRKSGSYVLEAAAPGSTALGEHLIPGLMLQGGGAGLPFASIAEVRTHLQGAGGARTEG
ncbi:DcrB-related protein [Massilia antarctica]|uniref:DcrB-related protein n=1 Tax=Massilia antarctica TaxID=2765360 RepID=UPI0006BB6B1A|nr:DcrB-related protein [Massilia sp. H27-R4]MCY0915056.1 DcrB-related protein [Massilia sp. H27-R4]CUI07028.1 miscellaneous; hypothetical/partial homology [Janthinobacterium sp. CG23_2]CUU30814.1 miscellaneous; hypothetical/partial homology [Janthinobacterium sp. CG23_2]